MRAANDMPGTRRVPGRGRVILVFVAVALFILFTSLNQIAGFWTDYLWFDSLSLSSVWSRTLNAKLGLAVFFTLVFFVALWLNLVIADRIGPTFPPMGPDDELLLRYHQLVDRRASALRVLVSLVFAVVTGVGMVGQWNEWLLFNNGGDFGTTDPEFGMDVGFYMFRLPFLQAVVDWAFASMVIVLLITTAVHYLNGGIRVSGPGSRVSPPVKAHLSVLLAVLALIKAADYYLQRFQIVFSSRGTVDGATYTEVNAAKPALTLLLFIALAAVVLFIINIRRRGWVLPVVAVGLWAFVQIVVGGAYPALFQAFVVQPAESSKEAGAIDNNIKATRAAYGLDRFREREFDLSENPQDAVQAINANPAITRNVPLLDPDRVLETFRKKQGITAPMTFNRLSTDRYMMNIDGKQELTQVVLGSRELDANNIPQKSWESEKLIHTHGYGLALSASNAVSGDGSPDFAVKDIPLETTDRVTLTDNEPDNYYFTTPSTGSRTALPNYSVVDTGTAEWDPAPTAPGNREGESKGGVAVDSFLRRAAFYLRFGDRNLVISNYLTDQSKILYVRDVRERVKMVAPFLALDSNPYPAVIDNHTVYIIDAYTTSDRYPNAEHYPNVDRLRDTENLRLRSFNYVRNSVKAVVDTYDGSVRLYIVDKNDPVAMAYEKAFPDLFEDGTTMSAELKDHLRYPTDLFEVQTNMYGRYHITDPRAFYNREGAWEPPQAPTEEVKRETTQQAQAQAQAPVPGQTPTPLANAAQQGFGRTDTRSKIKLDRMAPYYVLNKLQGDAEPNFMLMRSYQPFSEDNKRNQLASFVVARSDGEDLGAVDLYRMPAGTNFDGPALADTQILSDGDLSRLITELSQQASTVLFSDLILLPIDQSLMYTRSMYVVSNDTQLVRYVLVYANGKVHFAPTLREAMRKAFPGSDPKTLEAVRTETGTTPAPSPPANQPSTPGTTPGTTPGQNPPPSPQPPTGDVAGLLRQARQALQDADARMRAGDLAGYEAKVEEAQRALDAAAVLTDGGAVPTTPTTAAPAPTQVSAPTAPP